MLTDPAGPGAAPLAVLCKDVQRVSDFQKIYKAVYKYEVLGGLHTFTAKSQLAEEILGVEYYKYANVEAYVGLSDEQALRLAQRRNQNSHFTHSVTHRDLVSNGIGSYA